MLNTKLNLYNPDWIELVFADRNKKYGAFELRQHYGRTMLKAMAIAFTTIVAASVTYTYAVGKTPGDFDKGIIVEMKPLLPPPTKKLEKEQPIIEHSAAKQQPAASTIKFPPAKVVRDELAIDPPIVADMEGKEVASITSEGKGGQEQVVDPGSGNLGGTGVEPSVVDNKEYINVESMPSPMGGVDAWSKFLNKNLRFPPQAQDAGVGGRVTVSFVVEKDGHLTDITIIKGAGYGMDEEAMRVLKLAKPWRPGYQNGNAVRVRYTIPMNFQMAD